MPYDIDAIDNWTAEECEACMLDLNSERRNDVAANLEFYREHCRYLVSDDKEGIARDKAIDLSIRNPSLAVQLYRWPWGSYGHRFESEIQTSIEGHTMTHIATYRKGIDVLAAWREIEV